ncbi:hypothetical protein WSM22_40050 [Cytophagales bacterium WSM2-2]|nr:hypothetical protein WSM22_40050 [Cytophagales bacterium WSM2-2]
MSKVKKQHFVPQFYLKNFTDSQHRIYALDVVNGKSFGTSVKNIAHDVYFYDYEPFDRFIGVEQAVEKALAGSESKAAEILRKLKAQLEANDLSEFTKSDYRELADHILTQHKRTPQNRILTTQLLEKVRQSRTKGASDEVKQLDLEAESYDPQFQQIYGILSSQVLHDIEGLCDQYWVFWKNKTQHSFYTSDHPVVGHYDTDERFEIYFPITPKFSVSILLKDHFPHMSFRHQRINELGDPEYVKFLNTVIVTNCGRQVYSAENDFRLAEKIVEENSSLRDPNRKRIAPM